VSIGPCATWPSWFSTSWTTVAPLAGPVGARAFGRVCPRRAATADSQSIPATFPNLRLGESGGRQHVPLVICLSRAGPSPHRPETLNASAPRSNADRPEISPAVLIHGAEEGPKGVSREVIAAVVDMKQRNPTWAVHESRQFTSGSAGRTAVPPRRPAHVPDGIRARHRIAPGPVGRRRSCRTGTARHTARSAHGDPSQLMSVAGVSILSGCLAAMLEPQARPSRHTMRMTSRKGVAAGLGAKHSGRAKHRDRAMCDAYRSWRGGRMVDGRANTPGYAGSRRSTNS
jgi:hypothetical protein